MRIFFLGLIAALIIFGYSNQLVLGAPFSVDIDGMFDLADNPISDAEYGQQFVIRFTITNDGGVPDPFILAFQVERDGEIKQAADTEFHSSPGNPGAPTDVTANFQIHNPGSHEVTFFIWKSIDDQTDLISPIVFNFDVLDPPDTDGDGILDPDDSCVDEPETVNGYQDSDGCPDVPPVADTDGDGILDPDDSCVDEPETVNGYQDSDGCPDSAPDPEADRYNEAYTGLPQNISPKVEVPILEDFEDVPKPEPVQEKKETRISKLQDTDDPEQLAEDSGLDYDNGKTRLLVVVDMQETTMTKIEALGQIEASSQNQIQLVIEIEKIPQLLEIEEIKNIRPINRVIQNLVTVSEGVEFVNADDVQLEGLTGKGVKVAVLDTAFDSANSKISKKIKETKSFRNDFDKMVPLKGEGTEYVHGTAVAEIISDVAPDAELYLYTFSSELEFDEAANYAAEKVDVIAMSAGWTNYPTDGSSSMTQTVEKIIEGGTTFVISAGNYAETHWEGSLTDSDSNGWHEFQPGDEGLSFNVDQNRVSKIPILAYLMWEEPSSGVYDLDLTLINDDTEEVVDTSANVQLGFGDSFEYIYFTPQEAGIYSLGISYEGTKPKTNIEIFSPSDRVEYATVSGSVSVPTDAKGVISVGAINFKDA